MFCRIVCILITNPTGCSLCEMNHTSLSYPKVIDFIVNELRFRRAISDIVNENGLLRVRVKRQTGAQENVTADNVFLVGPSPLTSDRGLEAVTFVQSSSGEVINGTELTEAVQNNGPSLAQEVCCFSMYLVLTPVILYDNSTS